MNKTCELTFWLAGYDAERVEAMYYNFSLTRKFDSEFEQTRDCAMGIRTIVLRRPKLGSFRITEQYNASATKYFKATTRYLKWHVKLEVW